MVLDLPYYVGRVGLNLREEKEDITGYKYESWHYRYVGKKVAKYIKNNNYIKKIRIFLIITYLFDINT